MFHASPAEPRSEAVEQALALGDGFAHSGAYDPATTEYKCVLFFDDGHRLASTVQLYSGDPWDALNAFALNTGLGTLIFTAMKHDYYLGNRENARIATERRNRITDQQLRERIIDQILSLRETE